MFDLEKSIAEWRRQMLAAGIKTPVPLEELEIHLREEIEQQMKSGLNEQEAFTASVQKIGQAHAVQSEFKKVEASREVMRFIVVNLGIVLILVGFFIFGLLLLILAAWDEMLQQVNRRRRLSISLIWASLGVLNFVLYLQDGGMRKPFQLGVLVAIVVIWPLFIIHNFRRWRKNRSFTSPLT
jgi:accessory gene regulator protein AgrB